MKGAGRVWIIPVRDPMNERYEDCAQRRASGEVGLRAGRAWLIFLLDAFKQGLSRP